MYENFADRILDPNDIEYCPVCGKKVYERCRNSGEITCECGFKFFVIEADGSAIPDDEDNEDEI